MTLFVREFGRQGPAVVLLHGTPSPPEELEPLARALADTRRAYIVDMPGYGNSPVPTGGFRLDDVRRGLEEALLARGIDACALIGFSGGAYRALDLALAGRVRATAIVSLGGLAGYDDAVKPEVRRLADAIRARMIPAEVMVPRMLSAAFAAAHPEACEAVKRWVEATTPDNLADEMAALADAPNLAPRLGELDAPIVARVGELDAAVPAPFSEVIARAAKRGTLEVVPGVGHAILFEDFEATLASIRRAIA